MDFFLHKESESHLQDVVSDTLDNTALVVKAEPSKNHGQIRRKWRVFNRKLMEHQLEMVEKVRLHRCGEEFAHQKATDHFAGGHMGFPHRFACLP